MKAYPTNFKKPLDLSEAVSDERYQCANGTIVLSQVSCGYWFTANVVSMPPHLGTSSRTWWEGATWSMSGEKHYPENWPPGSDIVRKL